MRATGGYDDTPYLFLYQFTLYSVSLQHKVLKNEMFRKISHAMMQNQMIYKP